LEKKSTEQLTAELTLVKEQQTCAATRAAHHIFMEQVRFFSPTSPDEWEKHQFK
jgi:hypothetical protein